MLEDAVVRDLDGVAQVAREAVARLRLGGDQDVEDRVHGHLRGDLARRGAAHAVTYEKQGAVLAQLHPLDVVEVRFLQAAAEISDQQVVFVVLANEPDVGLAEDLN